MTTPLVIVGAGGFGRQIIDFIDETPDSDLEVVGWLDDGEPDLALLEPYGLPVLGGVDDLATMPADVTYLLGVGRPQLKRALDARLPRDRVPPVLVAGSATVCRQVTLGPGTIVGPHVYLANHQTVGRHVHFNIKSGAGHDVTIGDYVTFSPQASVTGNIQIEDDVFFGTFAVVNPGVRIGRGCNIGSGAVITRHVKPNTSVIPTPPRRITFGD